MVEKDLYEILGVSRDASKKEITRAYRKKAMKYHPDRNPEDDGAVRKFKEATEAYEVLCNPKKRQRYDRFGTVGDQGFDVHMDMGNAMNIFQQVFQNMGFARGFGSFGGMDNDFFSSAFSSRKRGRKRSRRMNGGDVRRDIEIDIRDAAKGVKRTIEADTKVQCPDCLGSMMAEDGEINTCSECGGSGEKKEVNQTGFLQFVNITSCSACGGTGEVIEGKCSTCKGEGRIDKERRISIDLPAGVSDGSSLILKRKGHAGISGGAPGDLFVVVNIPEHPYFKRNGDDILVEVPITVGQALGGDTIKIPTLNGEKKVKIKPGTEPDTIKTLKGKGMPHLNSRGRGDMHIRLFYVLPDKLSQKQKKLVKLWSDTEKKDRAAIRKTLKKEARKKAG